LPKISEAFREGRVSYSKVRAMTRAATPENEDFLLDIARYGTASHVEKLVRHYRRYKRFEKLEEDNIRFAQRKVSLYQDDDDTWVIRGRLTAEQGALLEKALHLGVEQLFQEQKAVPEEIEAQEAVSHLLDQTFSESFEARRADALERMAHAFLADRESMASGGDAYLVNIHTDVDTLKVDGEGAASELDERGNVSACMDSSSFARSQLRRQVRLLTCIRSLYRAAMHATLMGYSHAGSLTETRVQDLRGKRVLPTSVRPVRLQPDSFAIVRKTFAAPYPVPRLAAIAG
jgi:hypothetical protein